ncbi:mitogen-activated protein kinase kinase kinase 7-like isoform X2 [Asterias rubens]|uniref:mitogen-activated protein kinase kinase kinase 7-like isoform X2 n=1 Tax=Asterias rubens TaxID=7604 RepID=UPI001455DB5D|nr:mitogen-activated protein kinase kinase kinase 7-like isoform X2 [Asterias rubens]
MAKLQHQVSFAEEIEYKELKFEGVVGKGAFGVVSKVKWRGKYVAVKMIESEEEIKAFRVEVRQLSRVYHPNIVTLYGACTRHPVCLVMEYAEGGSLYNILHGGPPKAIYTAANAMSWAFQCAKGVAYLHSMTPRALIHRDLKPANLLLMAGGTVLKICDFGTACDIQTHMTNNKGSAAWMAPEVFEGSNYSEKCDVFSWGIILWEVISRRKPFDEIGGPAFRIMWAVHEGTRPPMIRSIPKPLEKLMTRCWAKEPPQRPAMAEVVGVMSNLMKYFDGHEQPLRYETTEEVEGGLQTQDSCYSSSHSTYSRTGSTTHNTVIKASDRTEVVEQEQEVTVIKAPDRTEVVQQEQEYTPPSNVITTQRLRLDSSSRKRDPEYNKKRRSAEVLGFKRQEDQWEEKQSKSSVTYTHRRSNSHGKIDSFLDIPNPVPIIQSVPSTPTTHTSPSSSTVSAYAVPRVTPLQRPHSSHLPHSQTAPYDLYEFDPMNMKQRSNSDDGTFLSSDERSSLTGLSHSVQVLPQVSDDTQRHTSYLTTQQFGKGERPVRSVSMEHKHSGTFEEETVIPMAYMTLDHHLRPLEPNPNSRESMEIFATHRQAAQELVRIQTEMALFHQRKKELADQLDQDWKDQQDSLRMIDEHNELQREKETLMEVHKNLRSQLDIIRAQVQRKQKLLGRKL